MAAPPRGLRAAAAAGGAATASGARALIRPRRPPGRAAMVAVAAAAGTSSSGGSSGGGTTSGSETPTGGGSASDDATRALALSTARARLLSLLDGGSSSGGGSSGGDSGGGLYGASPELAAAVDDLIKENPTLTPGLDAPEAGVGVWEVFYAPHIVRLSSALGARFEPIRYTLLPGGAFVSNVKFKGGPLLANATGWLSAAGTLVTEDEGSVRINFTDFWVDIGEELRPRIRGGGGGNGSGGGLPPWVDAAVESLGRAFFFPALSVFPVLYLDSAFTVFQFTPLSSNIGARRAAAPAAPGGESGGGA